MGFAPELNKLIRIRINNNTTLNMFESHLYCYTYFSQLSYLTQYTFLQIIMVLYFIFSRPYPSYLSTYVNMIVQTLDILNCTFNSVTYNVFYTVNLATLNCMSFNPLLQI